MNLEAARVHAERGARALVHHAIVPLAIDLDPHGIYAIRWQQLARIWRREVDRRHPDRPSPPRAPLHHGPQAVPATQPALGRRQVAVRHGGPDERRRDRLPVVRHGRDDVHRKPVLARQPPHHLYVARAPAPAPRGARGGPPPPPRRPRPGPPPPPPSPPPGAGGLEPAVSAPAPGDEPPVQNQASPPPPPHPPPRRYRTSVHHRSTTG